MTDKKSKHLKGRSNEPYMESEITDEHIDAVVRYGYKERLRFEGDLKSTMRTIRKKFNIDADDLK